MKIKATTKSGAVYFINTRNNKVTGGSKKLTDGFLLNAPPELGSPLHIATPGSNDPENILPYVRSSPIIKLEQIQEV